MSGFSVPSGHMADHLEAGGSLEFFVSTKCLGSLCNRVVLKKKHASHSNTISILEYLSLASSFLN